MGVKRGIRVPRELRSTSKAKTYALRLLANKNPDEPSATRKNPKGVLAASVYQRRDNR